MVGVCTAGAGLAAADFVSACIGGAREKQSGWMLSLEQTGPGQEDAVVRFQWERSGSTHFTLQCGAGRGADRSW